MATIHHKVENLSGLPPRIHVEPETFTHAAYIIENQPKSIFCAPLLNRGCLTGISYLENNLTAGVFTPDTRKLLSLLLPHLALVLENAALTLQVAPH